MSKSPIMRSVLDFVSSPYRVGGGARPRLLQRMLRSELLVGWDDGDPCSVVITPSTPPPSLLLVGWDDGAPNPCPNPNPYPNPDPDPDPNPSPNPYPNQARSCV